MSDNPLCNLFPRLNQYQLSSLMLNPISSVISWAGNSSHLTLAFNIPFQTRELWLCRALFSLLREVQRHPDSRNIRFGSSTPSKCFLVALSFPTCVCTTLIKILSFGHYRRKKFSKKCLGKEKSTPNVFHSKTLFHYAWAVTVYSL